MFQEPFEYFSFIAAQLLFVTNFVKLLFFIDILTISDQKFNFYQSLI